MFRSTPVDCVARPWKLGRDERRHHRELLADTSVGRPAGERDAATGARHPGELAGNCFVVGSEHHAAGRRHRVEARVVVVHFLGVADFERDVETSIRRQLSRGVDENRREVHSDNVCATLGCEQRNGARPGRRVEPSGLGCGLESIDDERMDVANRVRDPLVGPVSPHDALPRLQL